MIGLRIGIDFTQIMFQEDIESNKLPFSIAQFTVEIVKAFVKMGNADQIVIFTYDFAKDFLKDLFPQIRIEIVESKWISWLRRLTRRRLSRFIDYTFRATVRKSDADLVWFPYTKVWRGDLGKVECLSTVHDLIDYHRLGNEYRIPFEQEIKQSGHLVAISKYVRQDCIDTLKVDESKFTVIPNIITLEEQRERKIDGIDRKYILDINAFRQHKNTITLIKAYGIVHRQKPEMLLVLCGGGKDEIYFQEIKNCIYEMDLQDDVKILYQVHPEEINWLYNHAEVFVTPSTQEGFGRTPVEAALRGIPVVSTKETSLYEATMGLVNYVNNPYDEKEMAEAILSVLKERPNEKELLAIAEQLSRNYASDRIAAMYWKLFMNAVETN